MSQSIDNPQVSLMTIVPMRRYNSLYRFWEEVKTSSINVILVYSIVSFSVLFHCICYFANLLRIKGNRNNFYMEKERKKPF